MNDAHLKCFISYSHKDEKMCKEFREQIACLERFLDIEHWYDGMIPAGGNIDNEIKRQLENSDIVFLLISPAYIQSYYCYEKELAYAIERHAKNNCKVIPVIIKKYTPGEYLFSDLKFVPTDGKPVANFKSHNDGFVDAMAGIKSLLQNLGSSQSSINGVVEKDTSGKKKDKKDVSKVVKNNCEIKHQIIKNGKIMNKKLTCEEYDSIVEHNLNQIRFVAEMNNLFRESIDRFKDDATKTSQMKKMRYRRNMEDFMFQTGAYIQHFFVGYNSTCIHYRRSKGNFYIDFFEMGYSKNELSIEPISAHNGMIECSKKNNMPVIKKYNKDLHQMSHPNESVPRNYITFTFNNISELYNIDLSMCISIVGTKTSKENRVFVAMSIMRFDLLIETYLIQYIEQCKRVDSKYDVNSVFESEVK